MRTCIGIWIPVAGMLSSAMGCGPTVREAIQAGHVVNARQSIVGLDVAPLGRGPEAPRVSLGSSVSQFSAVPSVADETGKPQAPPVLNRTDVKAPGVRVTDTVGVGSVGEQIDADVVEAIRGLHGGQGPSLPVNSPPAAPDAAPAGSDGR